MSIKDMIRRGTIWGSVTAAAVIAAAAVTASAAAPSGFAVYDAGSVLVTAHHVTSGEHLVIAGRPFTLGSVAHPGPAYVARVLGVLPAAWAGKTLTAVVAG